MPKYPYQCEQCSLEIEQVRQVSERDDKQACEECGGPVVRRLSRVMEPTVMETADQYRNVKWRKDQDARIRKRAKDYFIENELPDLIEKHGKEHAEKVGWIKKDGTLIKKKDLK